MKKAIRHSKVLASGTRNLPIGCVQRGGGRVPNVNLGPPKISKTTKARMLKLKTQLYIVKYINSKVVLSVVRVMIAKNRK